MHFASGRAPHGTRLRAPTQTAATGSWKVSMSGSRGGADHRRRRVDLDHRQPPASLGNRVPSRVCALSLTHCVSISFCQVSRSTIGGVAVMLVSFMRVR